MKKTIFLLFLIATKISASEISWDTLVPNQSIVLKNRFHQHGWMPFAEQSGLLKSLTVKEKISVKEILDIVKNSIDKYNKTNPGYFSNPKITGWNYESSLFYTIFYPHIQVRQFLFKQDPLRFDSILDKDSISKD